MIEIEGVEEDHPTLDLSHVLDLVLLVDGDGRDPRRVLYLDLDLVRAPVIGKVGTLATRMVSASDIKKDRGEAVAAPGRIEDERTVGKDRHLASGARDIQGEMRAGGMERAWIMCV